MEKKHPLRRLAVIGLLSAALILTVAASQGSAEDPLVTLGYLTEKFLPQVVAQVEVKMAGRDKSLEDKVQAMLDDYAAEMEQKFNKLSAGSGEDNAPSGFCVVTLSAGQKLTLSTGGELLFRSGSAVCTAASSPGLVDTTAGGILEGGGALTINHLYLATDEERGLTASDAVTVLVRGTYIIT